MCKHVVDWDLQPESMQTLKHKLVSDFSMPLHISWFGTPFDAENLINT